MDQPQQNPQNNITPSQGSQKKRPYLFAGGIIGLLAFAIFFYKVVEGQNLLLFYAIGSLSLIVFPLLLLVGGLFLGWLCWYVVTKSNPQNNITSQDRNWLYITIGVILLLILGGGVL